MLNLVNHRCSFLIIFALLILISSCKDKQNPITGLLDWDYKYDYDISINGQGQYNCYVKPIDLNNDGHYKTVFVDFDNKPIPNRSELVFREWLLYSEGKFETHLNIPKSRHY